MHTCIFQKYWSLVSCLPMTSSHHFYILANLLLLSPIKWTSDSNIISLKYPLEIPDFNMSELIILPPQTWSFLFMPYHLHEGTIIPCVNHVKKKCENLRYTFPIILSFHLIHLVTKDSNSVCFTNGHCFRYYLCFLWLFTSVLNGGSLGFRWLFPHCLTLS